MCNDVPDFQRCDSYNAPLNMHPYALFETPSDDSAPSPQLSSLSSQVDLSSFNSLDEIPPLRSFPGQLFSIRHVPVTHGRLGKGKETHSHPGGVSAASAHSTHERELAGLSSSSTLNIPQVQVTSPCQPEHPFPAGHGDLVPVSPDYLNYVWTLAIFDGRNPFNGKTEEQNDRIRVLSEIYQGTDITLDRVLEILDRSHSLTPEVIAEAIDRLLTDLMINISAVQCKLVLKLASIVSPDDCHEDTAAAAGSSVAEKCPDVKIKEAMPDPWSQEPIEFVADDGYSKKRDACFSEAAKFLSETTSFAASTFSWRSFLDTATWNKADHSLHNAINTTTPIPSATFHPVVVDGMLRLYLTSCTPIPLAHPLYQYTCYHCHYFGHWSCHNGRGSRWTPATNVPSEDENTRSRHLQAHSVRSNRCHSPTPGPSVNPGRSGV
ncbi:hypothetical protein PISMIDRAFT_13102 [Pisolithus microcarpus 441]|uniref:Uncharacterized protein n=1 Tax=Pisolithus microcarpus 441 TaxID=765257 RepID=A0A0C9YU53_9AGAM|nr:hypothetical protein PISMIDRAFT_13102 [Pisolithus microcarpus 441]